MSNYLQSKWPIIYVSAYFGLAFCSVKATPAQENAVNEYPKRVYFQEKPIKENFSQYLIKELTHLTKGFIYDPDHPEKLFDRLIAGYEFVTVSEKQIIHDGEKLLGEKNQMVLNLKKAYAEHMQFLNALKDQRNTIVQHSLKN